MNKITKQQGKEILDLIEHTERGVKMYENKELYTGVITKSYIYNGSDMCEEHTDIMVDEGYEISQMGYMKWWEGGELILTTIFQKQLDELSDNIEKMKAEKGI